MNNGAAIAIEENVIVTEMDGNGDIITIKIDLTGEITVETQIEEILIEGAQEDEISTEEILTEEAQEDEISTEEILTEEAQEDEISTEEILEIIDLITVKKRFIPIMIGLAKSAAMSTFHSEKNATDVESQEMNSLKASGIATVAISKEREDQGKVMTPLGNSAKQEGNLQIMLIIEGPHH